MLVSTTSARERHAVAGGGDARAQFVVVGEVIDQGSEAADFVERFAAESQRGAEAVVQAALDPFGEQHAGLEVGGDAQSLKPWRPGCGGRGRDRGR